MMRITAGRHGERVQIAPGVIIGQTQYGSWQLVFHHKGERFRRTFPDRETAEQAARLLAAKAGIETDQPVTRKWETFEDVGNEWISANRLRWSDGTIERYESMLRLHINPVIGDRMITAIKRTHIKNLLVDALRIKSPKTVELIHAVVSGVFREAIEREYVTDNPTAGLLNRVLPPRNKRNQTAPDPFTQDELELFLESAKRTASPTESLIIELLACSGMRLGEALAFRPDQLDSQYNQYMITEAIRRSSYDDPKTGRRLIDLPEFIVRRLRTFSAEMQLKAGRPIVHPFRGIRQNRIRIVMGRACTAAKLRHRHPHDLRHTYASILLMSGASPAYVQKQLGHTTIGMTVDTYGHWIPGVGREQIEDVFGDGVAVQTPRAKEAKAR